MRVRLFLAVALTLLSCTPNRITTITNSNQNLQQGTSSSGSANTSSGSPTGASITLAWSGGAASPQGYVIQQSTDQTTYTNAATVAGSATSATISGLTAGTTYYFRIYSYNQTGNSSTTTVVSAKIP